MCTHIQVQYVYSTKMYHVPRIKASKCRSKIPRYQKCYLCASLAEGTTLDELLDGCGLLRQYWQHVLRLRLHLTLDEDERISHAIKVLIVFSM